MALQLARTLGSRIEQLFSLVVIPVEFLNTAPVQAVLDIALSSPWQTELEVLGGCDSSHTGTVVAQLPASS